MAMKSRITTAVFVSILLYGCDDRKYEIAMTPQGDTVERKLGVPASTSSEDLQGIAKVYHQPVPSRIGDTYIFTGKFSGSLPADLGNAGWYVHYGTAMGDAFGYLERLKGNDDLNAQLTQAQCGADVLVDYVLHWMESEAGKDPDFGRLKVFLDKDFRRDVKNIVLYAWAGRIAASYKEGAGKEFAARVVQYLAERRYFDLRDLPALHRDLDTGGDAGPLLTMARRLAAEKMGYNTKKPLPAAFAFLSDGNTIQKSFDRFLATTPEYHRLLAAWEKNKKDPKPDPEDVVSSDPRLKALFNIVIPDLALFGNSSGSQLTVKLACTTQPLETNGKWSPKDKTVQWTAKVDDAETAFPVLNFAVWSAPNERFQKDHFGKVVLDGGSLFEYCLWEKGLSESRVREWNAFLQTLRPGKDLIRRLDSFTATSTQRPTATTQPFEREKDFINRIKESLQAPATQTAKPPQTGR
jgi:hypothetical protein